MAYRNHRTAAKPSIYQTVTDRILSSLKAGVIPWEKPWQTPHFTGGPFPRNFRTGKPYRGINIFLLWSNPYSSPFWLTFKQVQELKGTVRKGEKGTQVIFDSRQPVRGRERNDRTHRGCRCQQHPRIFPADADEHPCTGISQRQGGALHGLRPLPAAGSLPPLLHSVIEMKHIETSGVRIG